MITSTSNEQVKAIRKLRERKYRAEGNAFYIEGIRIVREAMQQPERIKMLIVAPDLLESGIAQDTLKEAGNICVPVLEVSQSVFESFGLKENPQGIAAVVRQIWRPLGSLKNGHLGLWVGLDSVADPGNLGTIMRTLDAVGGKGLILIDDCTDPYDPAAVRGSMGALFDVELVRTRTAEFAAWKASQKIPVIGTSDAAVSNYQEVDYPYDMVLLMGSERQGLHPDLMQVCDQVVSIPMAGSSDSLNLAVATGVSLYEIYNQHRRKGAA